MAQVDPSAQPTKHTSLDYSLPPAFADFLLQPCDKMLDALLEPLDSSFASVPAKDEPKVPFLAAMATTGDTFTAKGAVAHKSTDSPIVDLFYEYTPGVTSERLFELLEAAWKKDAKSTFQIILQGRSIHEGKSMEEETFKALAWMWDNHPRTLLANLHLLVEPTCKRHKSKAREEAKAKHKVDKALKTGVDAISIGDDGKMEVETPEDDEAEEVYPARPHGAFKDLINILVLAINGQFTTAYTGELTALKESMGPETCSARFKSARTGKVEDRKLWDAAFRSRSHILEKEVPAGTKRRGPVPKPGQDGYKTKRQRTEERKQDQTFQQELVEAPSKKARHALLRERLHKSLEDKRFSALYLTVVQLFADVLRGDLAKLKEHRRAPETDKLRLFGLSFAAKWVPSPAKGEDRQLFFATALSRVLFPAQDKDGLRRETLQREVLTPLRAALKVPETKMVQGEWKIDYTSVPARAMARHASSFMKHDPEGFAKFLRKAQQGHLMISGASMMPHELLIASTTGNDPIIQQLADLQWKSLVDSIRSSSANKLNNCIAVADVSGSMGYLGERWVSKKSKRPPQPIQVCIALTLLLGELAEAPWSGSFLTFDDNPVFMTVDPTLALSKRATTLADAPWGGSTHFGKTFDLILETAKREKLAPEHMVKTLFVFSDMQFDQAAGHRHGETEHQTARRKFEEAGYPFPEMVYWNLDSGYGDDKATHKPVKSDTEGVALMSGFSGALMKYFLGQSEEDDEMESEDDEAGDEEKGSAKSQEKDEEWEEVGEDGGDGTKVAAEGGKDQATEKGAKKKKNPMDHIKKILQAESFQGVVIVD